MIDFNSLAQQIQQGNITDPQLRSTMDQVMKKANSVNGQQFARSIPPQFAGQIEQAAAAAQRGDMNAAQQIISQLMQSPGGADLARQFQFLMR